MINTERMENFKQFAEDMEYPMITFESESGNMIEMNHQAEVIFESPVKHVEIKPGDSLSKHNFWELLHKRKRLMRSHICLKVDGREYMVRGLIHEMVTKDDKLIYTLLFDLRSGVDVESLSLERIVYHAGMVAIDIRKEEDRFRIGYVSQNVEQYGYTQQQIYNNDITFEDVICEEDIDFVNETIENAVRAHEKEVSVECRAFTAEKELIMVRISRYYNFDENDDILGYEMLITDLREEQQRNKENTYLSNVVSKMKSVLIVKSYYQGNRTLKYISANAGILGMNIEALRKGYKLSEDYIHPEDRDGVIDSVYQAVASGATDYVQTYRMVQDDGTQIWVENEVRVNRISDGEAEVLFLITDISEIKKMEKELAAVTKDASSKEIESRILALPRLDKTDTKTIERFNLLAANLCKNSGYYGVVINLDGEILSVPAGPAENMGQFYDMFERSEFKEQFASISERIEETKIPQSASIKLNQQVVQLVFAPLIVEDTLIGYWILTSFDENGQALLGTVAELHWHIANDIATYFYSERVIENQKTYRMLAERRTQKLMQQRSAIEDMLAALVRDGENSLHEIFQKAGSYLFISDMGMYLENKETKNVEKYLVRNQSGEENTFGRQMELSVSEYHVLTELFKERPVLIVDQKTEEPFLKELIRKANMENMVIMPLTTISGQKGYVVLANSVKDHPFEEKHIPFITSTIHIVESAIGGKNKVDKKEIINEGILEAYDYIRDAVFVKEVSSGEIIFANKATEKLFGYSLVGTQVSDILNDQAEQYRHIQGIRKRFIANKKVTKWQSYMKELDQIMNIVEIQMETSSGKEYSIFILKKNKNK